MVYRFPQKITAPRIARSMARSSFLRKYTPTFHRGYLRLHEWWPLWHYILNNEARHVFEKHLSRSSLDDVQREVIQSLRNDGIATVHISRLLPKSLFEELNNSTKLLYEDEKVQAELLQKEKDQSYDSGKGSYITHLMGGYGRENPLLQLDDPFIQLSLNKKILEIIGSYLGCAPKLKIFSLHSTILMSISDSRIYSQNWHRDGNDKREIKMFLYLNDVHDSGAGPFTYIRGSQHGGRWWNVFSSPSALGGYPNTEELEKIIPHDDIKICTADKGTLIFADTHGLHRGGYSTKKRRIMYASCFTTQAGPFAQNYHFKSKPNLDSLPHLSQFALRP